MLQADGLGHILLHMVILFMAALIVVRLMGNRTVGQLSPFDFVIMVGIGDIIVTAAMDKNQTITGGLEGLVTLLILQQILGYLALKNTTLRKWVEGTPVTLIEDGKLIEKNFVKTQFNYDDLRQELHRQGLDMSDIRNIQTARLESCGVFSVIIKPDREPLTKYDLEQYMKDMYENPLSPVGKQWIKWEQTMTDVQYLVQQLKKEEANFNSEHNVQSSQELH